MLIQTPMAAAAALRLSFQNPQIPSIFSTQKTGNHHTRMVVSMGRAAAGGDGYTRVAMDTPGAYKLIDNETGENYIVWGGEENDPQASPVPPQQVLSWKPSSSNKKLSSHLGSSGSVIRTNQGDQSRSFGRLKAPRIRDIVKRSIKKKEASDFYPVKQDVDKAF